MESEPMGLGGRVQGGTKMIGMILSSAALRALTGYKQPSKQIAWLKRHLNLDPPVGADGYAKVSQAVIDQATLAKINHPKQPDQDQASNVKGAGPKWTVSA